MTTNELDRELAQEIKTYEALTFSQYKNKIAPHGLGILMHELRPTPFIKFFFGPLALICGLFTLWSFPPDTCGMGIFHSTLCSRLLLVFCGLIAVIITIPILIISQYMLWFIGYWNTCRSSKHRIITLQQKINKSK